MQGTITAPLLIFSGGGWTRANNQNAATNFSSANAKSQTGALFYIMQFKKWVHVIVPLAYKKFSKAALFHVC